MFSQSSQRKNEQKKNIKESHSFPFDVSHLHHRNLTETRKNVIQIQCWGRILPTLKLYNTKKSAFTQKGLNNTAWNTHMSLQSFLASLQCDSRTPPNLSFVECMFQRPQSKCFALHICLENVKCAQIKFKCLLYLLSLSSNWQKQSRKLEKLPMLWVDRGSQSAVEREKCTDCE